MNNENLKIDTFNTCLVLSIIINELDLKNTPKISKDIYIKLSELNYPSLIIDLNNIAYIDSMGISLLIMLNKNLEEKGQRMAIFSKNETINQVFNVIQMEKFLKIFSSLNESVDFIKKKHDKRFN